MKIAILYICTGKYEVFWKDFYLTCEEYFLKNIEKEYFVFCDANYIFNQEKNANIHKIYQDFRPWPYSTLMRYHMFSSISETLNSFDYIFFMNANIKFVGEITEKEILPKGKDKLVTVLHPGFVNKKRWEFSYDRNPRSTAYIRRNEGKHYVVGGLNGGDKDEYLKMVETLRNNIDVDSTNNVLALFHDESHFNRYIIGREDVKILPKEYIWPENWIFVREPKIVLRDKTKYINHIDMRGFNQNYHYFFKRIINKARTLIKYIRAK